jgi:hypothetical protein
MNIITDEMEINNNKNVKAKKNQIITNLVKNTRKQKLDSTSS